MSTQENLNSECDVALTEVMSAYSHHMTVFEARVWKTIIDSAPPEAFLLFLQRHILSSKFRPTPSDAAVALGIGGSVDPTLAYAELERAVRTVGPYKVPEINDPVLRSAINQLGGWSLVNEQMPDPSQQFLIKAFRDRFDAAYRLASVEVTIHGIAPKPLAAIGMGDSPGRLTLDEPGRKVIGQMISTEVGEVLQPTPLSPPNVGRFFRQQRPQ
jgi:hypothetical protein